MSTFAIRSTRLLCQHRSTVCFQIRRYAAKASTRPARPTADITPKSPPKISLSQQPNIAQDRLLPEQARKLFNAKRLYEQGTREIYRAPSHYGILSVSWLLGFTLVGTTAALGWIGHWDDAANVSFTKARGWEGWFVGFSYRLGMIFFTCMGAIAVLRYKGLIKRLDLVSHQGEVKLRVTVRRTIPFLQPRVYTVPTYDFRLPYTWMLPIEDPGWLVPQYAESQTNVNPLRAIGKAIYLPFKWFRTFIYRDGIMRVNFDNKDKSALLDTSGQFSDNAARDFLEITTTAEPWEGR